MLQGGAVVDPDAHFVGAQTEGAEQGAGDLNHLGVGHRTLAAEQVHVPLVEGTPATALRPLVAEELAERLPARRQRYFPLPGSYHPRQGRSELGTQQQRFAVAVLDAEGLPGDDLLAAFAEIQLQVLDRRTFILPVPVGAARGQHGVAQRHLLRPGLRIKVLRPLYSRYGRHGRCLPTRCDTRAGAGAFPVSEPFIMRRHGSTVPGSSDRAPALAPRPNRLGRPDAIRCHPARCASVTDRATLQTGGGRRLRGRRLRRQPAATSNAATVRVSG